MIPQTTAHHSCLSLIHNFPYLLSSYVCTSLVFLFISETNSMPSNRAYQKFEPIHTFSACSWRRDHDGLYFLKKCIFLSRVSCEAHFTRISSSLEKSVACRWRASIFSNVKKQVSAIQPIEHCVRLTREWWTSSRSRDHHGIFFLNKERVCV